MAKAAGLLLRGNGLATVDEGGRLKLPAGFRRSLEAGPGRRLFLTSLDGLSMWVWPLAAWAEKEGRILALGRRPPAVEKWIARTSYFGSEVDLDNQGRVLVPQVLRASAKLEGEVAVLGALDHLEVWNNGRFKARLGEDPITPEERQALADLAL